MGLILSVIAIVVFILMAKDYFDYSSESGMIIFGISGIAFVIGCIRLSWWLMVYTSISIGGN